MPSVKFEISSWMQKVWYAKNFKFNPDIGKNWGRFAVILTIFKDQITTLKVQFKYIQSIQ